MALQTNADTRLFAHDLLLREEVLVADIFEDFAGIMTDEKKPIPEAAIIKVQAGKGTFTKTITMLKALSSAGIEGRADQIGNEEEQSMRSLSVFANNFSNAVNVENYGIDAKEMDAYSIRERVRPQLGRWAKERIGRYKREAINEVFSGNLTVAPTSKTKGINANILFAGVAAPVTYNTTLATYVASISSAAPATPAAANRLSQSVLDDIIEMIQLTRIIEPIAMTGGRDMWILTVPTRQKKFLLSGDTSSSFYETFKDADIRGTKNQVIKHALGSYGNLILIEDPRSSIVTVDGTVSFAYKGAGDSDGRNFASDNDRFDVCQLLGKGALYEYTMEEPHFEDEIQGYKKNQGIGVFQTKGWRLGEFEAVTPGVGTIVAKTSALIFCGTN